MKYFSYSSSDNQLRLKTKIAGKEVSKYVQKTKNIIIIGSHGSGKTRMMDKFAEHAAKLYKKKEELAKVIFFKASDSIAEIIHNNLEEGKSKDSLAEFLDVDINDLTLNQITRIEALKVKAKKCILIIDDVDKLSGKKLELAKEFVRDARIIAISAFNESMINKTIYDKVKKKSIEYIDLKTTTSKDATNYLFIGFVAFIFLCGWHELALLLMAGKFAMRGMGR